MSANEYLVLFLEPVLAGRWLEEYPARPALVTFADRNYRGVNIDPQGASVFYDFLFTPSGRVSGVEIHPVVERGAPFLRLFEGAHKLPYAEIRGGFPTAWLSEARVGEKRPLEAFSMDYMVADDCHWAILLPTAMWLSREEIEGMRQLPILWV